MAQIIDGQPVLDLDLLVFKHGAHYCFQIHDRRCCKTQVFMAGDSYAALERQVVRVLKKKKAKDIVFLCQLTLEDIDQGRRLLESKELGCLQSAVRPLFVFT